MPRLITGLDARRIAANLERIRDARSASEIQILAAVKYVPLEEMDTLREAGLTLLGENRAQELEEKADRAPGLHAGTSSASCSRARSSRSSRTRP